MSDPITDPYGRERFGLKLRTAVDRKSLASAVSPRRRRGGARLLRPTRFDEEGPLIDDDVRGQLA